MAKTLPVARARSAGEATAGFFAPGLFFSR